MEGTPNEEVSAAGQNPGRTSLSRRELLKKAGWAVPAIVALPLLPSKAHAHRHASPGGGGSYSKPSDDKKSWSKPSKDKKSWSKPSNDKTKWSSGSSKDKDKANKALQDLLKKLFGRR